MNDLLNRITLIENLMNQPLSNSAKVMKSLDQFSGLVLSDLSHNVRNKLESELIQINHIVMNNNIKTNDDFGKMNKKDLKCIIEILSRLCYELKGIVVKEMV